MLMERLDTRYLNFCTERLSIRAQPVHKIPYMDRSILFWTVFVLAGQPIGRHPYDPKRQYKNKMIFV